MKNGPLVGISTCLLGENVRYDGTHKLNRYLRDCLGRYVRFVPVCPEVECGMGVPREALRLVADNGTVRLMTQRTKKDMTGPMQGWISVKLEELKALPLCGFIFKSKSPSSGLSRVKVYGKNGTSNSGTGLFAGAVKKTFPDLPLEEDGRLNDEGIRENFIERIFVMNRWHRIQNEKQSLRAITDFHAGHKYLLMSHDPAALKQMGAFLAGAKQCSLDEVYLEYFRQCMRALKKSATVRKNVNVLMHLMGYFKKDLSPDEKKELLEVIDDYHRRIVPLIVVITLLKHYRRKYGSRYLEDQVYLDPHPMELMLRNHV